MVYSYEVVKEFVFYVEGLDFRVKARIMRDIDPNSPTKFSWDVSHLWKTEDAGGFYSPSVRSGNTMDDVEALVMAYTQAFSADLEVRANEYY